MHGLGLGKTLQSPWSDPVDNLATVPTGGIESGLHGAAVAAVLSLALGVRSTPIGLKQDCSRT
jgi:hypothetical protein